MKKRPSYNEQATLRNLTENILLALADANSNKIVLTASGGGRLRDALNEAHDAAMQCGAFKADGERRPQAAIDYAEKIFQRKTAALSDIAAAIRVGKSGLTTFSTGFTNKWVEGDPA